MPPSVNSLRACVRGRLITTKVARAYYADFQAQMVATRHTADAWPYDCRLVVVVTMHHTAKYQYDVGNYQKAPVDAIVKAGVIRDDCLIDFEAGERGEVVPDGKVRLEVHRIEADERVRVVIEKRVD